MTNKHTYLKNSVVMGLDKQACTGDKLSSTASQFAIQKWPSCCASLKCIATSCDAFLLQLLMYIESLFMFLM